MSGISTTLSLDGSPFFASLRNIEGKLGAFRNTAAALTASFTGILAIGPAISNAFSGITDAIGKAGDMESLQTSFEVMLGDAKGAKKLMEELVAFGAATPFEMEQIAPAAKSLLAFGVAAEDITETLRRVGDVSSGIGAPIGDIAEIYGKARVQGRLFAEDINQLTGRGIPVIKEFAKQFGVTESEVRKLVESGSIGFANLERAFVDLTSEGGKFNGMMDKQSQGWNGLVSTFRDGVSQLMVAFGQPLIAALKPQLAQAIAGLGGFEGAARSLGQAIGGMSQFIVNAATTFVSLFNALNKVSSSIPVIGGNLAQMVLGFVALKLVAPAAVRGIQSGLSAIGLSMIRAGGQIGVVGTIWKVTCSGMTAAFRGALLTMKSLLISTGIGALVVALSEGVAWAYRKISNLMDRGKSGKAVDAKALKDVQGFADRASKLDNEDSKASLVGEVEADIAATDEEANIAAQNDDPRAEALRRRAEALKKVAENIRQVPAALLEENAAHKKTTELIRDETKQREEAEKAVKKQLEQYEKSKFKHELDSLPLADAEAKVRNWFNGQMPDGKTYDRGGLDLAGVEKEIERLKDTTDLGEMAYLDKLIEGAEMLQDLNKKRADLAKKAADMELEHGERVAQLRAELEGQDEKLRQLRSEEKLRERIKKLTDLGISDAKGKATEEVNLEDALDDKARQKSLQEYTTKFRRDLDRIKAEAQGDKGAVAEIDRQQKIDDYAKEAKDAGVTDPVLARQLAEQKANAEFERDAQRGSGKSSVFADGDRRIGLGGTAVGGTSDPLLKAQRDATLATKKNTDAMTKLASLLEKKPQIVREIVGPVFK